MAVSISGDGAVTGVASINTDVSSTELGYLDGVTSAIQPQIAGAGGLVLLSTTNIGNGVTSFTISNAFSAAYKNYRIILQGGVASGSTDGSFILGSTTTGYYNAGLYNNYATSTPSGYNNNNGANSGTVWAYTSNGINCILDILQPYVAERPSFFYSAARMGGSATRWTGSGFVDNTTQYTSITFQTQAGHTITGGTVSVYGYAQ